MSGGRGAVVASGEWSICPDPARDDERPLKSIRVLSDVHL